MNKIFPIKSDTACILKWSWSTVFLHTKTTSSCHRVNQDPLTVSTFDSFHNTPRKIKHREMMRQGVWPGEGCEYCKNIEDVGGTSDRMFQLENMTHKVPEELYIDPNTDVVNPTLLEVYFSNLCNMACLYCGSYFSSVWEAENKKYGEFIHKTIRLQNTVTTTKIEYQRLLDKLFQWLEKNYQSLQVFQVLGGEPFYQIDELNRCLDFFDTHPNPNMAFSMVSNLKVAPARFKEIIDRLLKLKEESKISSLNITGSIDSWGKPAEYVRYGLDLDEFASNIEYMLDKPIIVCLNSAINSLEIKTMPALIEKINYWNSFRSNYEQIYYNFMTVQPHHTLRPDIFSEDFFAKDFENIISLFPENNDYQRLSKDHMIGIAKQIASTPRVEEKIETLKIYLDEIDRRRNTNWKELFPWLINA